MAAIVTKDFLLKRLEERDKRGYVIGRILLAIFNNQTTEEQANNGTKFFNNIGFTKPDARIGCIGAKSFLKNGTLEQWVVDIWMAPNKKGQARIVKYARQLNEIAKRRKQFKPNLYNYGPNNS